VREGEALPSVLTGTMERLDDFWINWGGGRMARKRWRKKNGENVMQKCEKVKTRTRWTVKGGVENQRLGRRLRRIRGRRCFAVSKQAAWNTKETTSKRSNAGDDKEKVRGHKGRRSHRKKVMIENAMTKTRTGEAEWSRCECEGRTLTEGNMVETKRALSARETGVIVKRKRGIKITTPAEG